MRFSRRILNTAATLYLLAQTLFLINIQFPTGPNFDEFHYIPSAKQFLQLKENQNWEHPPLGKLIMAVGIAAWGDRPIGWRFMSTVFGSLTLVGMYFLGLVLFESEEAAIWIALLTFFNQLLYVQARIGMLDTFMFAFLVWAMVGYCAAWLPTFSSSQNRKLFAFSGLMFGLSMACKWFTVVPWVGCGIMIGVIRIFQNWKVTLGEPRRDDWYQPKMWAGIPWYSFALSLGVLPVLVYFCSFLPYLLVKGGHYSIADFIAIQAKMFNGQLRVVSSHPYMSTWVDWPFLKRPIWYAFDRIGPRQEWVRGVILLGNPLVMWAGMVALLGCLWGWIVRRDRAGFLIFFFFTLFYACWIVIPRKIAFYYYYYPAGMTLSLAMAYVFFRKKFGMLYSVPWLRWAFLGSAVTVFFYFFPILAALRIPADSFRKWMWFPNWI
ncbi:MAG: glycosyltransferase family 39 protein [Bdellovibrionia bacterium]